MRTILKILMLMAAGVIGVLLWVTMLTPTDPRHWAIRWVAPGAEALTENQGAYITSQERAVLLHELDGTPACFAIPGLPPAMSLGGEKILVAPGPHEIAISLRAPVMLGHGHVEFQTTRLAFEAIAGHTYVIVSNFSGGLFSFSDSYTWRPKVRNVGGRSLSGMATPCKDSK